MAVTKLVLVRHGESEWNKENRFTGWTDVELSDKGRSEAKSAGKLLKEQGFSFDFSILLNLLHYNQNNCYPLHPSCCNLHHYYH